MKSKYALSHLFKKNETGKRCGFLVWEDWKNNTASNHFLYSKLNQNPFT